jgi:basic membrane protein A and related proteins
VRKIGRFCAVLLVSLAIFSTAQEGGAQNNPPLKVAMVFDVAGRGDGGFNDSAARGLERAVLELGVKAFYIDAVRNLDRDLALNAAAESDVGMIIGVGFAFTDPFNELAARYPGKKFVCVDYSVRYDDRGHVVPPVQNLAALTFKEEEGAYLVGAIAAWKSRTGKIGFIGGMDSPVIRKFLAGYQAGAEAARPDILVVSEFAGITGKAFNDPMKGQRIATRLYGEGADIIFHASGATGAGLFRAARRLNKLAVGVDIDQRAQAPGLVLTSMTKHIDVAVFESIKAWSEGRFSGGIKIFGLKENGIGFVYDGNNQKLIPEEIYRKTLALKEKITNGELVVPSTMQNNQTLAKEELLEVLAQLHRETVTVLNRLDADLALSAKRLSGLELKGTRARNILKQLYRANPYIIDCETVSDKGIMLAVEPEQHRASEGADISGQAHMIRLFATHKPVLSGAFRSVEGPEAVVIHHPIFSSTKRFTGSVSALFAPEYLLGRIIGPVLSNLPVGIPLMQTDGLMIHALDTRQIGLNVFSDPLFKPFPELIALLRRTASEREGTGSYSFFRKGSDVPVIKEIFWKTISLHGTEWRIAITCARDSIAP